MNIIESSWKTDKNRHKQRGTKVTIGTLLKWGINATGPGLFILSHYFIVFDVLDVRTHQIMALALWMLIWWVTEFIPLAATSLLPIVIFPSLGIMTVGEVVAPYSSSVIFLFLGGFIIALALEKWNLHKRIALVILKVMGSRANFIILGFIIASAFLSMWISNTATAVMMLPIILSVVGMISKNMDVGSQKVKNLRIAMLLGVAYGASIGGMGTLIGSPPNAIFAGYMNDIYNLEISFLDWMVFTMPVVVLMIFIMYIVLTRIVYPNKIGTIDGFKEILHNEIKGLGRMGMEERATFIIFISAAFLWVTRSGLNYFLGTSISDTSIAVFVSVLFFVVPTSYASGERLLEWKDTHKLPWGVLLLFGGGLSIASALSSTGVLTVFGDFISSNKELSIKMLTFVLMGIMLLFTEFMSNTALATIFLPVIVGIGVSFGYDPVIFAAPMIVATSCVFSLPMGTPPNAIIFASGELRISNMIRAGVILDPTALMLLTLIGSVLAGWALG